MRAHPARVMAQLRRDHELSVADGWAFYRLLRDALDHPVSLRDLTTYQEAIYEIAEGVALPEVSPPPAVVPEVRPPEPDPFALEAPPVEIPFTDTTKQIHDVTARIEGPASATPDQLKNVWWRVASGHHITTFKLRVVNWRKRARDGSVKEYIYGAMQAAEALGAAKPFAIVQGGKKALRVARVAVDEYEDWAEYEITVYYGEEA